MSFWDSLVIGFFTLLRMMMKYNLVPCMYKIFRIYHLILSNFITLPFSMSVKTYCIRNFSRLCCGCHVKATLKLKQIEKFATSPIYFTKLVSNLG